MSSLSRLEPFDDAEEDVAALLVRRAPRRRSRTTTVLVLVLVFLLGVLVGVSIGRGAATFSDSTAPARTAPDQTASPSPR